MKQKTYLERGAVMIEPGTETNDASLSELASGIAGQPSYSPPGQPELISTKAKAETEEETETETETGNDDGDVEVEVEIEVEGDDDDDEDETEAEDECNPDTDENCEFDEDGNPVSIKSAGYKPPQLMSASELHRMFSQG